MLRQRGWLGGWVSVTRRYCIKTAKPILKLFRPSGSPIILVSSDPAPILNSCSVGYKYTRVGKIWRFSSEIYVYLGNGMR